MTVLCISFKQVTGVTQIIADIAQVIIAAVSLWLAYTIWKYQSDQDKKSERREDANIEKGLKIQFLKEIIIIPNQKIVEQYYNDLYSILNPVRLKSKSKEERLALWDLINLSLAGFRTNYIVLFRGEYPTVASKIEQAQDEMIGLLNKVIIDENIDLTDSAKFQEHIELPIAESRTKLISALCDYRGD